MTSKFVSTHDAVRQPGDMMITEAAARLNRGYTWVYERLPRIHTQVYRYKGVIFIRQAGFCQLQEFNARAPRRGRPRKVNQPV